MKTRKQWICAVLALAVIVTLTACASPQERPQGETQTQSTIGTAAVVEPISREKLDETAQWLVTQIPEPTIGSVGGEWLILGLARWGAEVPGGYYENYFERLAEYTAEKGGVLHSRKYTEYSRVILALSAIGRDPRDVGGFDLLQPLADFDQTVFQGINGAIFALLALDSRGYEIPTCTSGGTQATRERYLDYILNAQCPDGGWTLSGQEADVDITAMALQALAKYRELPNVEEAVQRGVSMLAQLQQEDGGYMAYDCESSESIAQVIVALTELGIDPAEARFVKNGRTLQDKLLEYRQTDGSFRHDPEGETDLMATEQAFYALVALARAEAGDQTLYSMG